MTPDTATRVREVLAQHFTDFNPTFNPATLTDSANLIEDLGADSLDALDLKVKLEDEFHVELDHLDGLATVGKIINKLEGLTNGR